MDRQQPQDRTRRWEQSLGYYQALRPGYRPYFLLLVFIIYCFLYSAPVLADGPIITQEFRYQSPEAGEVYLIWGINGWQVVPEEIQPEGTVVDSIMMTPMKLEGDTFAVQVQVPAGAAIDYGFQTRKKSTGTPIEWVWDGDYRLDAVKDDIVESRATVTLAQAKEFPLEFRIGPHLLVGVSLVFGLLLVLARILNLNVWTGRLHPATVIGCLSLSLYFLLLLMRASIMRYNWVSLRHSLPLLPDILAAGYYDLFYVSAIALVFLGLLGMFRKNIITQRILLMFYTGLALFSLLVAFVNLQVIHLLGRPFNYQWFYYSGFLKSEEAKNAILANVSTTLLLNTATTGVTLVIGARLLMYIVRILPRYSSNRPLVAATIVPLVYFPIAGWYISTSNWDYAKLANPVISFIQSIAEAHSYPVLFTLDVSKELQEFQIRPTQPLPNIPSQVGVENVVIFVMESVAAEYLEAYGGSHPVTPELNSYRQQSLLFNNIYAHAPASNKSLASILGSIYPWVSYRSLTQEYPDVNLPTLSSELKKYGYRSVFLSAGDISFQRGDEFLAHSQFETIADHDNLKCERQKFDLEWANSDGVDEECLVDAFSQWQAENPEQPFFAFMWTVGTHYPYFVVGEETDYGVSDENFNRYLNALHHSDRVLGKLIRILEERGLHESTLVVVVGDHGEAFGDHDQFGHASKTYEENVHIPLLLINPMMFNGEENPALGGLVDIAPTIAHVLDLPAPEGWQGQSLLSSDQRERVYFFAPWQNFLFGYREGDLKFMFNASTNQYELYDLRADPDETTNLAGQRPEVVQRGHRHLAAWVQYQEKFINELSDRQ